MTWRRSGQFASRRFSSRAGWRAAIALAALAVAACQAAGAETTASAEAPATSSQPAAADQAGAPSPADQNLTLPGQQATSAPEAGTLPALAPHRIVVPEMTTAPSPAGALDYNSDELTILSDLGTPHELDTPALYVLLRRSQMLPEDRATLEAAQQPTIRQLWDKDDSLRGQLVRVQGRIHHIEDWTDNAQGSTRWWGQRKVFIVYLTEDRSGDLVLVMLSTPPNRGVAARQQVQFAGIYYKLVSLPLREDASKHVDYPVLVARQVYMHPQARTWGYDLSGGWVGGIVVAVVVLAGAYAAALRSVRKRRVRTEENHRRQRLPLPPELDQPVDQNLIDQVQAFRNRQDKDSQDGGSGKDKN